MNMTEKEIDRYLLDLDTSDKALTQKDYANLMELADSPDAFFRSRAACLLAAFDDEKSLETLLRLSHDGNDLVRIEAADSLCIAESAEVLERLLDLAEHDDSPLVRGYAVLSVLDVSRNREEDMDLAHKKVLPLLAPLLKKEKNAWTLGHYYSVFYECGQKAYLQKLMDCLGDEDYRVRSSTTHSLLDLLTPENEAAIREAVAARYETEDSIAVRSGMEKLLDYIDNYEWEN